MTILPVRLILAFLIIYAMVAPSVFASEPPQPPLTGYVVHFDFISDQKQGRQLVRIAAQSGAQVINIVPPAHIWENRKAIRMLDAILREASRLNLSVIFTRIDAAYPPDAAGIRENYLYKQILNQPGRMPDGKPTVRYFRTTVGRAGYARWMEDETRYYARNYGRLPNLLGINLGPFSEPFASERGGFLEYMQSTGHYELTQYTPEATYYWQEWLSVRFHGIVGINSEYGTSFLSVGDVPIPINEKDRRFGTGAEKAYYDACRAVNDWFVERYERCRRIWHEESGRNDVPFILQFSGFVAEKLAYARPGAAAFDLPGWVSRADALGLSLYTNSGYPDYGHASNMATIRFLAMARDLRKDVFVLEGGCEAPHVVLNESELRFFASAAAPLSPKVWIYEFLKEKFDEEYPSNPGKLVRADGRLRPKAVKLLGSLFAEIRKRPNITEMPRLLVQVDSTVLREDSKIAQASLSLFDLAGMMPIRWMTPENTPRWPSSIPLVRLTLPLPQDAITRVLATSPGADQGERIKWGNQVSAVISSEGSASVKQEALQTQEQININAR